MLAAWGFTFDGRKVLLPPMAGSKEDGETVSAFRRPARPSATVRLKFRTCAPAASAIRLVASDGASGIIEAVETCFSHSTRQRCLAHRMRCLAVKDEVEPWPKAA